MTTKLGGPLKREIEVGGTAYTLTITPDGMALVLKGKRKGFELQWNALVSGDAALATALNASLTSNLTGTPASQASRKGSKATDRRSRRKVTRTT